jgi:hemerythrin superfamily protein
MVKVLARHTATENPMAKATASTDRDQGKKRSRSTGDNTDAIALLKADHREVEGWFEEFENARTTNRKQELATKICAALRVHSTIEEEIFYPAFIATTEEEDLHNEAQVEHDGAKYLIAKIEKAGPDDQLFDAEVKVLSEMIKHHVNEEEKRDGMFAKARQSDMDLEEIGQQLQARKAELQGKKRPQLVDKLSRA